MSRYLLVSIPAKVYVQLEVPGDATDEEVAEAVALACPTYPRLKAGHFDPAVFEVIEDIPDEPEAPDMSGSTPGDR